MAALGVTEDAESVYRLLLEHPLRTTKALAAELALPQERVDAAVAELSKDGLVRNSAEDASAWWPVRPDLALHVLVERQRAEMDAQRSRLSRSQTAVATFVAHTARQRCDEAADGIETLRGIDRIREYLRVLTSEVRSEMMVFAPDGAQTTDNMEASRPLNDELLGRGVVMRTLYQDSARNNPATIAYARWISERGGSVRTAPILPTRMIIVDRSKAILPLDQENSAEGAVVISSASVLFALCSFFDLVWMSARPLTDIRSRDESGLSTQEVAVLRLLAEGQTDEVVAKRLAISTRTARRIVSGLTERLGAQSRFEAGVRAVQCGWLPTVAGEESAISA
ncbi:helix-turn-helix transcriptional regulator [Streptomyces sp. NPDC006482]|uniref:helix-turn-helix transcriptional regulator n=1 Tax=Streptomyces sp. NPDC006482 TaxID=3154306 RepID=UPI0033ABEFA0